MILGRGENRTRIPFPGTYFDFLDWCGGNISRFKIERMNFEQLEKLPVMKRLNIESVGATSYLLNRKCWKFVILMDSKYLRRGEKFTSIAMENYNSAFLAGLILIWELYTRREKG